MYSTLQLVNMAVGDPDLRSVGREHHVKSSYFDIYRVKLPSTGFNGIPSDWIFVVLVRVALENGPFDRELVLKDAYQIIHHIPPRRSNRLVLVSDDPRVRLGDEFGKEEQDIFCLDHFELAKPDEKVQPRIAPFVLAVRRRMKTNQFAALSLSPYSRGKPVSGWQFFGRKKQLEQLVNNDENFVIVGARRVGKSSLMQEAARRLREQGEIAHCLDVQNCRDPAEVIGEILRVLSPRDLASSIKHNQALGEPILSNVLRRMATGQTRTTLFLDELGNVITNLPKEDWSFLGVLRKYGQQSHGRFRFVISCFQEMFLRQQQEFSGPLINLAHTMRLSIFRKEEVDQFVQAPLDFWRPTNENEMKALLRRVHDKVGRHPYFLQYFCYSLFEKIAESEKADPNLVFLANTILGNELLTSFQAAVEEFFERMPSSLLKYLFFRMCVGGQPVGRSHDPSRIELDDDWLKSELEKLELDSSYQSRRNLLEGLEMHGLCVFIDNDRTRMAIATPIVYDYFERDNRGFGEFFARHANDARREADKWGLTRLTRVQTAENSTS